MGYTIERIEEGWMTLEDDEGVQVALPARWLPGYKEGDVLNVTVMLEEGAIALRFELDPEARRAREDRLLALRGELTRFEGDIESLFGGSIMIQVLSLNQAHPRVKPAGGDFLEFLAKRSGIELLFCGYKLTEDEIATV